MTSSLIDDIAAAPDEPEPDLLAGVEMEAAPVRTRQRGPGRPRKIRIDPETGEPIEPTPRQPRNAKLAEELLETTVSAASDISAVAPTVAGVLIARAETTVDGLVALASGHKRTTAVLRRVAKASKIAELLTTFMLIFVAAAVDFGRIPSDSPLLDNLGFTEIVKDNKGKPTKDDQGKFIKDRTTLRYIYDTMHDGPQPVQDAPQYPNTSVTTERGAPPYMTPMNMMAGTPPWERPEWT